MKKEFYASRTAEEIVFNTKLPANRTSTSRISNIMSLLSDNDSSSGSSEDEDDDRDITGAVKKEFEKFKKLDPISFVDGVEGDPLLSSRIRL